MAGITITIGVYALAAYLNAPLVVFVAAVIAAIDAKYARIWRVDSALPERPSQLFFWMLLLGWLFLPWYLATRFRMMSGVLNIKGQHVGFPYRFRGRIEG